MKTLFSFSFIIILFACANKDIVSNEEMEENMDTENQVQVIAVAVSGEENNYTFNVTLKSPDTGCDQYANWWEVFDKQEELIYRRILGHSHVNEQPFTRSGGAVKISEDQFVYIRGHMNNLGYGTIVFGGSVKDGFQSMELETDVAADLSSKDPQPGDCPF